MSPETLVAPPDRRSTRIAAALAAICIVGVALSMTYRIRGDLGFALELRARRVGALVVVGAALGYATVLFHTVTHNRILTPNLLGLDALYVLVQMLAAVAVGSAAYSGIDVRVRFALELAGMLLLAAALHRWVVRRNRGDLQLLVLVGIVIGTMLGAVTALVSRLIDPNEFLTLQDRLFASFSAVDRDLLIVAAAIVVLAVAVSARWCRALDVVALGDDVATNLGVDHRRLGDAAMGISAVLVAVATALVGPLTFLGLLASNLGYHLVRTHRHRVTLPVAAMLGVAALVFGQFVLEHLLGSTTRVSIIVGFVGGVTFITILLKEPRR